jgi:hypothetical protein
MVMTGKCAVLAMVALGLTGCGSAGKTPVAAEATGAAVLVYAAGSLREVLTAIASEHEARTGQKISLTCGASATTGALPALPQPARPRAATASAAALQGKLMAPPHFVALGKNSCSPPIL